MARFYGTVQGGRSKASRMGHANTGLHVTAQSYSGDVKVKLYAKGGEDYVCISVQDHGGFNASVWIYDGPIATLLEQSGRKTLVQQFAEEFMTGQLEPAE